ncbi:MAG: tetratricopeptide repeat protein [Xenococcaceae cyanobacterium MO_207.B15]|nr:tetratricopeptide repeat protein [Xenococcaceae cyanobacterium MO_207.B15]
MSGKFLVNLSFTVGISSLLFLGCAESKLILPASQTIATTVEATKLTNPELETIAQAITVKVHVGEYRGSGILINRDNNTYTVITNAHVAERGDTVSIETSDGIKHTATLISKDSLETVHDLATLKFKSSNNYHIAIFGDSTNLTVGEEVLAAGFPFDADKLNITTGTISLLPDKSLQGGYQIGFTNETRQGMSGGVLLNSIGEVIGVLGKGKGAIFDSAYTYSDGTTPTAEELESMKNASFSIPIAKVAEVAPQLTAILPLPEIAQTPTQSIPTQPKQYTGIVGKVDNIAQQITVRIDNLTNNSNGSGVIIAKQGKTYYVLTAKHVICTNVSEPICEHNGKHQIVTPDGVTHKLDYQTVEANQAWLDLAIFSFESSNNYAVATLGKYDPENRWIFVSGFPQQNVSTYGKPTRLITGGRLQKEEEEEFRVKETGSLTKSQGKGQDGLVYTNISYGGMSGGAILDREGRLIGINTGSENDIYFDDDGNYSQLNLGLSLGEAISDFLGYLQANKTELKEAWLNVDTLPATKLIDTETDSIKIQLLTVEQPLNPSDLAAWMNYGNQLWRYRRFAEAVSAFEKVIELDPNFDKAYYAMGLAFGYQREYEQAVRAFKKATEINPTPYYYWRYLGLSYTQLENYAEAKKAYNTAISKNPEDFVLYIEQGYLLYKSENYQGAINSYNQAIKLNSDHPWAYNNRGNGYTNLQQYQKAIADYELAIEINPQGAKAYNNRGSAYSDLQQYQEAIADYELAIEINPQYADAYYNRGNAYFDLKQYQEAIADYELAIEINPRYTKAYNNRGNAYADLQQYQKAIADYAQVIKINPRYAKAYNNRGTAYFDLKQHQRAIADYAQAIKINPQYAEAYYNRGNAYFDLKQYQRAIADYNEAININPQYAKAYLNRGVIYANLQQYQRARENWEQAAILFQKQNNSQGYQFIQGLLKKLSPIEAQQ